MRNLLQQREPVLRDEGAAAGEHLVQNRPERVDVGAVIDRLATRLFRRHVFERAEYIARTSFRCKGDVRAGYRHLCEAEVQHFEMAARGDHHVAGFQVAMHDAGAVCCAKRVRRLPRPLNRLRDRHRAHHRVAERAPFHQLHHEHVAPFVLENVVDRDDVRVVQCRCRACLAQEQPTAAFVLRQ